MDSFHRLGRYNLLALQKLNSSYIAYIACVVYFREISRMFEKDITRGQFYLKKVVFFGKYEWGMINSKTVIQCNICWCSTSLGIKGYEVDLCINILYGIHVTFNNNKLSHFNNHEVAPLE